MSNDGASSGEKRSLPSWLNSRKDQDKPNGKKQVRYTNEVGGRESKNESSNHIDECAKLKHCMGSGQRITEFSKLLKGVVFALSGFVNPERSILRSQALEMGAEYKPDWTSDCTLLVCAFPNTPKFRQVEADCGTIVSKEWISECHNQKKLVEIDQYLMYAGKPWRKHDHHHHDPSQHKQDVPPRKSQDRVGKTPSAKMSTSEISENSGSPGHVFSPSMVKEWAIYDLKMTISWLESQEERPDPDEVKKIAAEGVLTCLQDAIEALRQDQNIKHAMEQWMFVPRVVKELAELEDGKKASLTKKELIELAITCSKIYETKLRTLNKDEVMKCVKDDSEYDSDATIEMTEEEIELAYKGVGVC